MAYGARLESVLGETPQGFESPTLRAKRETPRKGRFLFSAKWLGDSRSRVAAGPLPSALKGRRPERGVFFLAQNGWVIRGAA